MSYLNIFAIKYVNFMNYLISGDRSLFFKNLQNGHTFYELQSPDGYAQEKRKININRHITTKWKDV